MKSIIGILDKSTSLVKRINVYTVLVGAILIVGFILRSYGNNFGLPMMVDIDEVSWIFRSVASMVKRGDWNPVNIPYGSLLLYIDVIFLKLELIMERFGLLQVDAPTILLTARYIGAAFGTLTLLVVYYIGKVLYNKQIGLVAMVFLMSMPLAVFNSHYGLTDTPQTFFITLSFLFASMLLKNGKGRYYVLAGVSIGLATSTKYPAAVMLIPLFISHILRIRRIKSTYDIDIFHQVSNILSKNFMLSIFFFGLTFLTTNPYLILDSHLRDYWLKNGESSLFITKYTPEGHLLAPLATWQSLYINSARIYADQLKIGIGENIAFLAVLGIISTLIFIVIYIIMTYLSNTAYKNMQSNIYERTLLISWMIVYFVFICSFMIRYSRYTLPILPFLALFGAKFLVDIIDNTVNKIGPVCSLNDKKCYIKNLLITLACLVLIITPLQQSIASDMNFGRKDTRVLAFDWIKNNIPEDSKIIREHYVSTPQIEHIKNITCICIFPTLQEEKKYYDINYSINNRINYVVMSNLISRSYPDSLKLYSSLEKRSDLIKVIENKNLSGPEIRIYRIREVPLPSGNIGGLFGVDPFSGRKF